MKGSIYAYSASARGGFIRDGEGNKYFFNHGSWISETPPADGMDVEFMPQGRYAVSVTAAEEPLEQSKVA